MTNKYKCYVIHVYSYQCKLDEVWWGSRKHFLLLKTQSAVYHACLKVLHDLYERERERERERKRDKEKERDREKEIESEIVNTKKNKNTR